MPSFDELMSTLDPKVVKQVKLAKDVKLELLPLASVGLSNALGGGIGKGRITLLYGNTGAAKSSLMLESVAGWQKAGLTCVWVDAERAFSREWAEKLGVNVDELLMVTSKSSTKIEEELKPYMLNGVDVIVIDSISAILPAVFVEEDGNLKDDRKQMGAHAKAITNLINGLEYLNDNTAVVLISQTQTDLGSSAMHKPQIPHGGKKTRFAASQTIKVNAPVSDTSQIKDEILHGAMVIQAPVGREVEYLVEKNRMGRPLIAGKYKFYYAGDDLGIDTFDEILSVAVQHGIIKQGGSWFTCTLTGVQYQGKKNLVAELKSNAAYWDSMRSAVEQIMSDREPIGVAEDEEL